MADDIARLGYDIDSSQARTAAGDLDKLAAASSKVASGYDSLKRSSANLLRNEKGQFISAKDAADKYGSEIDDLRRKYIPMYAASKQLSAAQDEVRRALELGAISSDQASMALKRLDSQYLMTGNAARVMGKGLQASTQHSTNLLFQFQDISMMLAAGQNPLMLAMQQGTQVAGVFHQMKSSGQSAFSGIKAGLLGLVSPTSLLTVGVIAGGAALVQWATSAIGAADDADTLADAIDKMEGDLDRFNRIAKVSSGSLSDLSDKYGQNSREVRELSRSLVALAKQQALMSFNQAISESSESLVGLTSKLSEFSSARLELLRAQDGSGNLLPSEIALLEGRLESSVEDLRNEYGLTTAQAYNLKDALDDINNAATDEQKAQATRDFAAAIGRAAEEGARIPPELADAAFQAQNVYNTYVEIERAADGVTNATHGITDALDGSVSRALDLRDALNAASMASMSRVNQIAVLESQISAATRGANVAAAKASAETAQSLAAAGASIDVIAAAAQKAGEEAAKIDQLRGTLSDLTKPERRPAGGGRGGGASAETDNGLDAFVQSLMTERETLEMWRVEQLDLLGQFNDAELSQIGGQNEAKIRLEQEYQNRIAQIRQQERNVTLNATAGLFGSLQSMAQSAGEKGAKTAATFGAIQATIASYVAATKAMAESPGNFLVRIGAYAKVLATGLAGVASIRSAGGGSGGGGGGSSAPSGASSAAQAEPERVVRISVQGEKWMRDLVEGITTQLYEATEDGARVVIAR